MALWLMVKKLLTTFFMFLRVPVTHLDRWLAFFTKFPPDNRVIIMCSSQVIINFNKITNLWFFNSLLVKTS